MSIWVGQLGPEGQDSTRVSVQLEDGRCRIWTDRKRVGSWDVRDVYAERIGVFRFLLKLDDAPYVFVPDDPNGFGDEAGAFIDLTSTATGRFGLAARIRQANDNP
jgi:hypothetical protein